MMGDVAQVRKTTIFAASAAAMVTSFFALLVFATIAMSRYGVMSVDFGWQGQKLGEAWFVSTVDGDGPAAGVLVAGDVLLEVNGKPIDNLDSLRNGLGPGASNQYVLAIQRKSEHRKVYLRVRTRSGTAFFAERMPLLVAGFLFFVAALGMLVNYNSPAARVGFFAASFAAIRAVCWAVLPLAAFFEPNEQRTFFAFWLPVGLAPALAFHSLLLLSRAGAIWSAMSGALYALWGAALLPPLVARGAIPVPVPDGFSLIGPDRIESTPDSLLMYLVGPLYLGLCVLASAGWVCKLYISTPKGPGRSRLEWLVAAGFFFALPGAAFEISQWHGIGEGALRWNWIGAMMAIGYAYVVSAERLLGPAMVLRSMVSLALPESVFQTLDRLVFPDAFTREARLRGLLESMGACRRSDQLPEMVASSLKSAFGDVEVKVNPEAPLDAMIELGAKPNGESYTRREERLFRQSLLCFAQSIERIERAKAEVTAESISPMNLLRECPRCGACYDSDAVTCANDGQVPVMTLPVERTIDFKYRIERLIGRGGMGAVYMARDLRLDRRVAIKVLLSDLFGQDMALKRFEREAQTVARLNHPNIIQVYDYGSIGLMGAYLVMEYCEGRTLRQELQLAGAMTPRTIEGWVMQLLDGVAAAHHAGIIHRDLKPENLLLVDAGNGSVLLKILDFGLAKMQVLDLSRHDRISVGFHAIGTIGYVPHEQLSGGTVDQRSDLYAIGRILIETLEGALPDSGAATIPAPLGPVLARATSIDRDLRYADIAEFRSALLDAMSGQPAVGSQPLAV